jgi:hypothetical protein
LQMWIPRSLMILLIKGVFAFGFSCFIIDKYKQVVIDAWKV